MLLRFIANPATVDILSFHMILFFYLELLCPDPVVTNVPDGLLTEIFLSLLVSLPNLPPTSSRNVELTPRDSAPFRRKSSFTSFPLYLTPSLDLIARLNSVGAQVVIPQVTSPSCTLDFTFCLSQA